MSTMSSPTSESFNYLRNRFGRIALAATLLFAAMNTTDAQAEVISDRIFYCYTIGNVCDPQLYSLPMSDQTLVEEWEDPLIHTVDLMSKVRNVTPPVSFEYAIKGGDLNGWENIKATASLVSPSGQIASMYVTTAITKEYSNLPCASYNGCFLNETATGYLPLGSEAGQWQLRLTYDYGIYKTIGTVRQTLPVTKNIMIANALVVTATSVPTTIANTTTTVLADLQNWFEPVLKFPTVAIAKKMGVKIPSGSKVSIAVAQKRELFCLTTKKALLVFRPGTCKVTLKIQRSNGRISTITKNMSFTGAA
jgi:hypothetical protein